MQVCHFLDLSFFAHQFVESEQKTVPIQEVMWPSKDSPQVSGLQISSTYFMSAILPSLSPLDTIIFLASSATQLPPFLKMLVEVVRVRCSQLAVFVCYKDASEAQEVCAGSPQVCMCVWGGRMGEEGAVSGVKQLEYKVG